MKYIKNILALAMLILLIIFGYKLFVKKPEIEIVKETVNYEKIVDSIKKTLIEAPDTVFIDTTKGKIRYIKGKDIIIKKDSIIYIDTTGTEIPIIKAQLFPAKIESNNAFANLSMLTTGTLLDVTGTITYNQKNTTLEVLKHKNYLYVYGQTSVLPALENFQGGIDYTIRDKLIIGTSIGYNTRLRFGSLNLKIGFVIN